MRKIKINFIKGFSLFFLFIIFDAQAMNADSSPCNNKENPKLINAQTVYNNITTSMTNPITKAKISTADLSCLKIIKGTKRHSDEGLRINVPKGKMVFINSLDISDVRFGLMKYGEGTLFIKRLKIHKFGEDALRIHDSNVFIGDYESTENIPTFPYDILTVSKKIHTEKEQMKAIFFEMKETIQDVPPKIFKVNGDKFIYENGHVDAGLQAYKCTNSNVVIKWGDIGIKPIIISTDSLTSMAATLSNEKDISEDDSIQIMFDSLKSVGTRKIYSDDVLGTIKNIELNDGIFDLPVQEKYFRFNFVTSEVLGIEKDSFKPISADNCVIKNIHIPIVDISTGHRLSQIFVFTDKTNYQDIHIGTQKLNIKGIYSFWINAVVLRNSTFGNKNTGGVNIICNQVNAKFPEIPTVQANYFDYSYPKEVNNQIVCRQSEKESSFTGLGVKINDKVIIGKDTVLSENIQFFGIKEKAFSSRSSEITYK